MADHGQGNCISGEPLRSDHEIVPSPSPHRPALQPRLHRKIGISIACRPGARQSAKYQTNRLGAMVLADRAACRRRSVLPALPVKRAIPRDTSAKSCDPRHHNRSVGRMSESGHFRRFSPAALMSACPLIASGLPDPISRPALRAHLFAARRPQSVGLFGCALYCGRAWE